MKLGLKSDNEAGMTRGHSLSRLSFIGFVILPVIAVCLYFGFFATDQYLCESILSVQDQSGSSQSIIEKFSALTGVRNSMSDVSLVDEYIHSPAMLQILQGKHDLRAHYSRSGIDLFSRLSPRAPWEDFLKYYNDKVETRINTDNGFIHLSVRSFTPEYCKAMSDTILHEAEVFVNTMSGKIQEDFIRFAGDQLKKSEEEMAAARDAMTAYQKAHHILDPEKTAENAMGIVSRLEDEMAATQVDLADKLQVHNASSPVIQAIKSRRNALQQQIAQEQERMTREQKNGAMTENVAEYKTLLLQIDFARQRYETTLALWEAAQAEALRKTRYIIPISDPRVPEEALGLNRLREMFGWSISIMLAYMLVVLLLLSVRDHIES